MIHFLLLTFKPSHDGVIIYNYATFTGKLQPFFKNNISQLFKILCGVALKPTRKCGFLFCFTEKFILLLLTIHIYGDIMIVLNIIKAVTRKVTVRILRRERTFGESPQG